MYFTSITKCIFSIRWKNKPAAPNTAYEPTFIEHVANIITHGVSISSIILYFDIFGSIELSLLVWLTYAKLLYFQFYIIPVIWHCHNLIHEAKTSKEFLSSTIYSAVSIGLFSVSTIFHIIACCGQNG